jgi:hypothetical protein
MFVSQMKSCEKNASFYFLTDDKCATARLRVFLQQAFGQEIHHVTTRDSLGPVIVYVGKGKTATRDSVSWRNFLMFTYQRTAMPAIPILDC